MKAHIEHGSREECGRFDNLKVLEENTEQDVNALGDKIPEFNKKAQGAGGGGLSGVSLAMGEHRTKLEVLVIALVAVIIVGGSELLLLFFKVPQYVLPTPSLIVTALFTEWPYLWPHLLTTHLRTAGRVS